MVVVAAVEAMGVVVAVAAAALEAAMGAVVVRSRAAHPVLLFHSLGARHPEGVRGWAPGAVHLLTVVLCPSVEGGGFGGGGGNYGGGGGGELWPAA